MKRAEAKRRLQRLLDRVEKSAVEGQRAALADVVGPTPEDEARGRLSFRIGWLEQELRGVAATLREVLS